LAFLAPSGIDHSSRYIKDVPEVSNEMAQVEQPFSQLDAGEQVVQ